MLPDLLQHLRCPIPHEESWLVASALVTHQRRIIEGTLGCPVCHAEYSIHDGVVLFPGESIGGDPGVVQAGESDLDRLAALLGIDDRGGLFILHGAWGALGAAAAALGPAEFLLMEPAHDTPGTSAIRGMGSAFPLAAACARGVALDRTAPELVADAVRVLAAGGRLLAPADAGLVDGVKLLARDDRHWVAERLVTPTVSAPVTPRRAVPRTGNR